MGIFSTSVDMLIVAGRLSDVYLLVSLDVDSRMEDVLGIRLSRISVMILRDIPGPINQLLI